MQIKQFIIALLAISLFACSKYEEEVATIEDIRLCVETQNRQCQDNLFIFEPTVPQISASVQVKHADERDSVTFSWYYVENGQATKLVDAKTTLTSENTSNEVANAYSELFASNSDLPIGNYEVRAWLADGQTISKTFKVQ